MLTDLFHNPDRLRAANINPVTGFATDYLNHYNEVAMSIASLADIPEMEDSVLAWRPQSYVRHFSRSSFRERDLAIAAYLGAPRDVRVQFLTARAELDHRIIDLQARLERQPDQVDDLACEAAPLFHDIARLGGIMHGGQAPGAQSLSAEQALVDALFD